MVNILVYSTAGVYSTLSIRFFIRVRMEERQLYREGAWPHNPGAEIFRPTQI